MKKSLLRIFAILAILVLSFAIASCDDSDYTGIQTQGFLAENGIFKVVVPNSTSEFDLLSKITFNEKASYVLSKNDNFTDTLSDGKITLNQGDNFIYVKVTDKNDHESTYTFNIYRKKMVTVTYNVNGGVIANPTVVVEEGTVVTAPNADKAGYSLSWDYDFKNPINADITINAVWTPFDCSITTIVDGEKTKYELVYGTVPGEISSPSKFGYEFAGWKYGDISFDVTKPYDYNETDIEIVAVFEPIQYVIQYIITDKESVTNNPENINTFTIVTDGGEFKIELSNPTHISSNFVFIGWSTDELGKNVIEAIDLDLVQTIGEDHTLVLYPQWRIDSNVTFDANGGELDETSDVFTVGESYVLFDNLVRDNYIFDGWYNGETKIANSGIWSISQDVTLTAKWIPRQNKIEYVLNGEGAINNENNPSSFDIEDGDIELLAPSFDNNHEFIGWYTNPSLAEEYRITHITGEMVGMDITLYAKWDKFVNITLDANGGTCDKDALRLQAGKEYSLPTPTRDKYHFAGWYYNGDVPVKGEGNWLYDFDLTITAKWEPKEYKITYKLNEGEENNPNNPTTYTVETALDKLVLLAPTKEFSAFVGWYIDEELNQKITSIDPTAYEGITLYPKWEIIKVTLNYDANGGSVSKEQEVKNLGDNYLLPIPVRTGYEFAGWYVNDVLFAESGRLTDESLTVLNLVAKWNIEEFDITYDLAGGSDSGINLINKYTILTEDFKLPTPSKNGYIFLGWSYEGGAPSTSVVITKGSVGSKAYVAKWMSVKDSNGLLYALVDGELVVTGIDRVIDSTIKNGIKFPHEREGYKVVAIESNAFKEFGEKFTKTSYANMSSSYVTFSIPTTIRKVGASAFDTCNGIKISLYDPNKTYADYEAWDKTVVWEDGNVAARDCIWGFRPAIGWTRYSKADIPDDYE